MQIAEADTDKCPLENLKEYEYSNIKCQFYVGTMAYRTKIYTVSVAHWQYVIDAEAKDETDEKICYSNRF